MRKSGPRGAIIAVFLLGAIIFGAVYYAWNTVSDIFQPASSGGSVKTISIEIKSGETTAEIATDLQNKGLIRNALAFRIWARIKGLDTHLQAGIYDNLNSGMTVSDIIDKLLNGQPDEVSVLIPEGWRLEQIAAQFANANPQLVNFDPKQFLNYTQHPNKFPEFAKYPILQSIPQGSGMEGLLFPDTYRIPINSNADDVINIMLKEFTDVISQNKLDTLAKANQMSVYQMVTLASIVEREIRFDVDRPLVASVYWNRIYRPNGETNGKLQADPTVQYARDTLTPPKTYWGPLVNIDPNTTPNSPWNTYINKGWPPTPISSPGLRSLLAAASPTKTDYYFFYARKSDLHNVYAKTLAEFLKDQQTDPPSI